MTEASGRVELQSVALMFPGQGSQFPGMGSDLLGDSAVARAVFEEADAHLGYSLSGIMAGDKGDELNRTIYAQPAIFVHSMALLAVLKERYTLSPVIAAGHSLGEYSALCAAGVFGFKEALEIIRVRAEGMDRAQPAGNCGMAAVIGLPRESVIRLIEMNREGQVLEAVNFNSPDQTVISGHIEAVSRMVEAAGKEKRTRAVMLPVSSAFHTELMESARVALGRRLDDAVPFKASFPVVANVTAGLYPSEPDQIRRLLTEQVVKPVLWEDCVHTMIESGAANFVEIGPGKVLSGLLRRIDRKAACSNISDMESIRAFQGDLQ